MQRCKDQRGGTGGFLFWVSIESFSVPKLNFERMRLFLKFRD